MGGKEIPYFTAMIIGKITAKAQTTVPLAVRRALDLKPGDAVLYEIDGDRVMLSKVPAEDEPDMFVNNFSTFTEWASAEDEAYNVLAAR